MDVYYTDDDVYYDQLDGTHIRAEVKYITILISLYFYVTISGIKTTSKYCASRTKKV